MGLFKKSPGSVPNRAASPNRRPVQSAEAWVSKAKGPQTAASQAHSNKIDGMIAKNAWESNNMKMRANADAAHSAKYSKPEPKKQQSSGMVERGFSSERM